jgi:NRE family putative nickel resistance protein-like MFS transporter
MRQYLDLLKRNRDIRFIWFAEVVSLVGDWFSQVVLLSLVVARSPGREGFAISTLILARFVPPLLLSPMAGVLLDRFNRQQILIWSNFLRAGVGVLYLIAIGDPTLLWLIYIGVILQALLGTVYMPGQSALVASVVRHDELVTANTLSNATWSAALAAGGALGGFVAATLGSTTALVFDVLTFVAAGTFLMQVRGYKYVSAAQKRLDAVAEQATDWAVPVEGQPLAAISREVVAESLEPVASQNKENETTLSDGLRYVRNHRPTLFTMFVKFGGSLGNVDSIMTILATQIFVMGTDGQLSLGIVYSAFGVGAIAGPLLANMLSDGSGKTLRRWILAGFVAQVLGWVILGWASTLILVCMGLVLRGMGGSVNWTYSSVLLQRTTPDHYRGRVFALDMTLFNLATAFATIVHGALIDALGPTNVEVVAFGTAALSVLPLMFWMWAQRNWRGETPLGLQRAEHVADA